MRPPWRRTPVEWQAKTRTRVLGLSAVGLTLLAWCGGPDGLDPPPPELRPDVSVPPQAPVSTISVPLAFPVSLFVGLLEDAVPRTYGTLDDMRTLEPPGRARVSFALERGPFAVALHDDEARIATTVRYAMRFSYGLPGLPDPRGSCGTDPDARPRLAIAMRSPISLDRHWSLQTTARLSDVRPASEADLDRCEVFPLGVDVTARVVDATRSFIEGRLEAIDIRAAGVDAKSRFEKWWQILQEPIELHDSLWLVMGPESVRRGPVRGSGDSVRVELAVRARPRIVYGARPMALFRPLPELDTGQVIPRLDLLVDARAEYSAGSRFLSERLSGSELVVGGLLVRIDSLRVYGIGGGLLALELSVSGDLRGRLFLTGSPTVDPATAQISVPDLEFDPATRRLLFPFLPELTARPLRDHLRRRASWPADPAVSWLTAWLLKGLNRNISDELRVAGTVDTVRIVATYARREALLVRLSAKGTANLFVEP